MLQEHVQQYWLMSPVERQENRRFLPCIKYDVYKSNSSSTQYCTIELKGSISSQPQMPVSFRVALICEPPPPPLLLAPPTAPRLNTIKIIRELYRTSSNCMPILEALSGSCDCSDISLCTSDVNCCTLLCEISFCLDQWEDLGRKLGMEEQDIQVIKRQYQWESLFESAYQMLTRWIVSSVPCLEMLVKGLHSINIALEISSFPMTCFEPRPMSEVFVTNLAKNILCYWKFIARLLGESETDICQAVRRSDHDVHEQAYQMLWKWNRQQIGDMDTFEELTRAIHCVKQHTRDGTLDGAVELFTHS